MLGNVQKIQRNIVPKRILQHPELTEGKFDFPIVKKS
jgi:hypothetical protein